MTLLLSLVMTELVVSEGYVALQRNIQRHILSITEHERREETGVKAKNGKKHSIEARKTLRSKAYGRRQDSVQEKSPDCTSLSVVVATSFLSVEQPSRLTREP